MGRRLVTDRQKTATGPVRATNMGGEGELWLDVSRLLFQLFRGRLTGIDRVEIAYAEQMLALAPGRLRFVAFDYWRGRFRRLRQPRVAALIEALGPAWERGDMRALGRRALGELARSQFLAPALPRHAGGARPVYVNVSTHPLQFTAPLGRLLARTGALFVPLVHDLIPLELPEYVPSAWVGDLRRKLATIEAYADGVIANSQATATALRPVLPHMPLAALPLGISPRAPGPLPAETRPYFVMLGTIEPRKNHLLMLHVWRRLVEMMGARAPRLYVIGRRGWDNEQVIDLLERSRVLRGHVIETGMLPDGEMAARVAGARALLMPSFAEGYGLPVAEALAMGVPVLCSDIAAHREVGQGVPDYLDPVDGAGWLAMIAAYAAPDSPQRAAQCARLAAWRAPSWRAHVAEALAFIGQLSPRRAVQSSWSRTMLATSMASTQSMNPATAVSTMTSQRTG